LRRKYLPHDKVFNKKLLTLVLPITFQQFMLAVVSASDAIMLGLVNQNSLSAVSLAGQVQFIFNLFLAALTIGASMFSAQYWGKRDKNAVEQILGIVLRISVTVSVLFFLAALCFPASVMRVFTPDIHLIKDGAVYLRTVSVSYLFCGISQIYLCIMKNTGRASKSSLISSTAVILNIILNAILIFGLLGAPKMGIAGAAAATAAARLLELIWVWADSRGKSQIHVRAEYLLHPDARLKCAFWKYTLPVLGNELVWGCGFTMYSVIMGHLGTDAVAANSIANIVKNLIACFCLGLGSGGGIIVGGELGAGRPDRAIEYGSRLCRLSIFAGICSGLVLLAVSPLILSLSTLSSRAGTYLQIMLFICSYYIIGKSVNGATIAGIFCAGGDSKFGLICDIITLWCITVPLGLAAAFLWKLPVPAVYLIISMDEIIKLPAVYKHYKKFTWVKDLTTNNTAK